MCESSFKSKVIISVQPRGSSSVRYVRLVNTFEQYYFALCESPDCAYEFTDACLADAVGFALRYDDSYLCDADIRVIEV